MASGSCFSSAAAEGDLLPVYGQAVVDDDAESAKALARGLAVHQPFAEDDVGKLSENENPE
jgi:hypothetical protein